MKKIGALALVLAALAPWGHSASAATATITILHVNDTHSHMEAAGPRTKTLEGTVGGIAKAATLIGRERAADPNALLLHAGDALQGDPSFNAYYGVPELEMIGALGFDAFTVGNHEFDFGAQIYGDMILASAPGFAGVPLLGANVGNLEAVPSLQARIKPWIVKSVNGVKVGIFGLTVPGDLTSSPGPLVIGEDVGTAAATAIAGMKAAGAEVVVFLSHLGNLYDRAIVQGVPGIDVVVGGHDHYLYERPVYEKDPTGRHVPILQAGSYWQHVGRLRLSVGNGHVKVVDYRMLDADERVPADPGVAAMVAELRPGMVARWGDLFQTKLGTAKSPLERTWEPRSFRRDTPLGNFITDAYREVTKTDIALTALGLVAERIAEGPVTGLDVFRAASYGYDEASGLGLRLAICTIRGADLMALLEIGVSEVEYTDALFPQTSGLTFAYVATRPAMGRVVPQSVFVNGRPLQAEKVYTMTTNDGIAGLVGLFGIPLENVNVVPSSFEYTVLRDEFLRQGVVRGQSWGRILDLSAGGVFRFPDQNGPEEEGAR